MPDTSARPANAIRGLVVHVVLPLEPNAGLFGVPAIRSASQKLHEAINLAAALNIQPTVAEVVDLKKITPSTLIGGGKVQELAAKIDSEKIEVVVVDAALSPRQQRELELGFKAKVLDRTGLILEIFASRARTRAGKLQVELARLDYQSSRLVRAWTHLERQRGGMGKTGGPGERQLEIDKRLMRDEMAKVRRELADVEQTRGLQRMARSKAGTATVALVGYTNAGKSTLFNKLVDAGTLVADALFATLDPLMRRLKLPGGLDVVLIDTVGFVADLPHELVEAFKATLEEVVMADVLLHVHDAGNPERAAQAADVRNVLAQIGAADKRVVQVYNKTDTLPEGEGVPADGHGVSAVTGAGIPELLSVIENLLKSDWEELRLVVNAADGKRLAWLYAHGEVRAKRLDGDTWHLVVGLRGSDVQLWHRMR